MSSQTVSCKKVAKLVNKAVISQLWIVSGNQPCLFTIPCWVNFETEQSTSATMLYAIPLLGRHIIALKARLEGIAIEDKGMWHIERIALARIGKQVDVSLGIDKELLFTWEIQKDHQMLRPEVRAERKDIDDFLDTLYQTGLPVSREHLGVIYNQICTHALDWLVNKERALDLHFVKLHNCPYRPNWKHVLLTRFPRLGWLLTKSTPLKREMIVNESGFGGELRCLDLVAMHRGGLHIQRSIEAEPTSLWYKQTFKVERERLSLLGGVKYGKYVMGSISRWATCAIRIYTSWLNTLARKPAADAECGKDGQFRLVPNDETSLMLAIPRPSHPVPVVVPNHPPWVQGPSHPGVLYPKNGLLPEEVSAVQFPFPIVRNAGPKVRISRRGRKSQKPWVLVPAPVEERHPLQLLGPEHGAEPGLADRVEQLPAEDTSQLAGVMP